MGAFLLAFVFYGALAIGFMHRLFPVWNTAIPGGLEDTRIFLWNAWWVHHALTHGLALYQTRMLFYPFGVSLISHDFPLWNNLITEIAQRNGLSLAAGCNLWFLITWTLGALFTFGLAREVTGRSISAAVAGLYVMTNSYTLARAMQNWGQFNLFGIPLFLWALVHARKTERRRDFFLAGAALAWTAACHYYFLIYCGLVWMALVIGDVLPWEMRVQARRSRPLRRFGAFGLAFVAAAAALAIVRHPGQVTLGRATIGLHGPENALLVMWLALFVWALSYFKFFWIRSDVHNRPEKSLLAGHAILLITALGGLSPLLFGAFKLMRSGGYPKQSILWKTHVPGANLFALLMPNPLQALWGPAVTQWYNLRNMNSQEQAAAIGWTCLVIVVLSDFWKDRYNRKEKALTAGAESKLSLEKAPGRRWLWLALAATVFSMGIYLHVAQWNTWCPLPFYVLRLLPIVGNVRVPERWMAIGSVSWAVVLALALVHLARQKRWPLRLLSLGVGALILAENWPGIPVAPLPEHLAVYDQLRQQPDGAVLPLPF